MIIVAGWIDVAPEDRAAFLDARKERVLSVRDEPGCIDYVFSADPHDTGRVRLFERWESREALDVHLAPGRTTAGHSVPVVGREVRVYDISSSEPLG